MGARFCAIKCSASRRRFLWLTERANDAFRLLVETRPGLYVVTDSANCSSGILVFDFGRFVPDSVIPNRS